MERGRAEAEPPRGPDRILCYITMQSPGRSPDLDLELCRPTPGGSLPQRGPPGCWCPAEPLGSDVVLCLFLYSIKLNRRKVLSDLLFVADLLLEQDTESIYTVALVCLSSLSLVIEPYSSTEKHFSFTMTTWPKRRNITKQSQYEQYI